MIIIDEAEHLPYKALELLRRIHDKAGVGVLLVGLPRLIHKIMEGRGEYQQLYSRIEVYTLLHKLHPSDTKRIVESVIQSSERGMGAFPQALKAEHRSSVEASLSFDEISKDKQCSNR